MNTPIPLSYLSEFLEQYPLYSYFSTDQPLQPEDLQGLRFRFHCGRENSTQFFSLALIPDSTRPGETPRIEFTSLYCGTCQSCIDFRMHVVISGGPSSHPSAYRIQKIGQYPPPVSSPAKLPGELGYLLDEIDAGHYRLALRLMEKGRGIGALAYLKTVLRHQLEQVMEIITGRDSIQLQRWNESLAAYRRHGIKTKFIESARWLLPPVLQPHGAPVLLALFDIAYMETGPSPEQESLRRSRETDAMFRYLARKMQALNRANSSRDA